jgi:hypothetical protein
MATQNFIFSIERTFKIIYKMFLQISPILRSAHVTQFSLHENIGYTQRSEGYMWILNSFVRQLANHIALFCSHHNHNTGHLMKYIDSVLGLDQN